MPRGSKDAYTDKQKRKAAHIEEGYEDRGVSEDEAERRAWATVNKQDGGGSRKPAGRRKKAARSRAGSAAKKRAGATGRKSSARKSSSRAGAGSRGGSRAGDAGSRPRRNR